jgi:hypothetical protein
LTGNAGAGGGESFVSSRREVWERTFAIDWWACITAVRAKPEAAYDYAELFSALAP